MPEPGASVPEQRCGLVADRVAQRSSRDDFPPLARSEGQMLDLAIRGPLERADLAGLLARAGALLAAGRGQPVRCDVSGLAADLIAVDALAQLALAARRHGCELSFRGASVELRELVDYLGLGEVLRGGRG